MKEQDGRGYYTRYGYDALNRPITRTEADETARERTTTSAYDRAGNLVRAEQPGGFVTTLAYDALHRLTSTTEAATAEVAFRKTTGFEYDPRDNLVATVDARTHRTETTYDELDRAIIIAEGVGTAAYREVFRDYDSNDNLTLTIVSVRRTAG